MDKNFGKKITRNLRSVKDRISVDLGDIMDRLIEREIFTLQNKDEINNAQPSTMDNRAEAFIYKLQARGQVAYDHFKEVLLEKGYQDLVLLMENTRDSEARFEASGNTDESEASSAQALAVVAADTLGLQLQNVVGRFEKILQVSEEKRDEERNRFEEVVRGLETKMSNLNDHVEELNKSRETERKVFEKATGDMGIEIAELTKRTNKLEHLQEMYKYARAELVSKQEKFSKLHVENLQIKSEMETLKCEHVRLKGANDRLQVKLGELEILIRDKENEVESLKMQIEEQVNSKSLQMISDQDLNSASLAMLPNDTNLGRRKKTVLETKVAEIGTQNINPKRAKITPRPAKKPNVCKKSGLQRQ